MTAEPIIWLLFVFTKDIGYSRPPGDHIIKKACYDNSVNKSKLLEERG